MAATSAAGLWSLPSGPWGAEEPGRAVCSLLAGWLAVASETLEPNELMSSNLCTPQISLSNPLRHPRSNPPPRQPGDHQKTPQHIRRSFSAAPLVFAVIVRT